MFHLFPVAAVWLWGAPLWVHPADRRPPRPAGAGARSPQCLGTGWRFPWGLRVRLCEMLLRGVFDTLEEGAYIAEADEYLQLLQVIKKRGRVLAKEKA